VTLGALWASLPGFDQHSAITEGQRPWLRLEVSPFSSFQLLAPGSEPSQGTVNVDNEKLHDLLRHYPSAHPYGEAGISMNVGGPTKTILSFVDESGQPRPLSRVGEALPLGFGYSPSSQFALRPSLGDEFGPPPSQLVSLWALMFALSQLARYLPEVWVKALDPDRSETAVPLEHGLDVALTRTPELLLAGLAGGPLQWLLNVLRAKASK
jgi:hypothetical protein